MVAHVSRHQCARCVALHRAIRTSLHTCLGTGDGIPSGHDVDGSVESRSAHHTCSSSFEHFDALDVGKRNWEIGGVVSCLRIGNADTVEQQGNLVKRTAIDRYVRLYTKAAALTDVHAHG